MNAKIMGVDNMDPFYGAPVVLIVLADKSRPTCVYDGSLVTVSYTHLDVYKRQG